MTHPNLVLTEKAIKNHCKRLHKEIIIYNKDCTLGQAQELFAKTLGFNSFYDLRSVLHKENNNKIHNINDFYRFIEYLEHKTDFIWLYSNGMIKYKPHNMRLENNSFELLKDYTLSIKDWEKIITILLSENDLKILEENDFLSINMRSDINAHLKRNIIAQFYRKSNTIETIKLIITYYSDDQFTKSYNDIKHLF